MNDFPSLNLVIPVLLTFISAAVTYFVIIKKTRAELAAQTENTLQAFREAAKAADTNEHNSLLAQMSELREQVMKCEMDKVDMIARLERAQTHIIILETRLQVLEKMPR
jgi:uncharacterized membrane protein (DUF106 family)